MYLDKRGLVCYCKYSTRLFRIHIERPNLIQEHTFCPKCFKLAPMDLAFLALNSKISNIITIYKGKAKKNETLIFSTKPAGTFKFEVDLNKIRMYLRSPTKILNVTSFKFLGEINLNEKKNSI